MLCHSQLGQKMMENNEIYGYYTIPDGNKIIINNNMLLNLSNGKFNIKLLHNEIKEIYINQLSNVGVITTKDYFNTKSLTIFESNCLSDVFNEKSIIKYIFLSDCTIIINLDEIKDQYIISYRNLK